MRFFFLFLFFSLEAAQMTLDAIEERVLGQKPGAYLCFGIDEVELAAGKTGTLWEQIEMEELFSLDFPHILKSLDLPYTALHGHRKEDRWAYPFFNRFQKSWEKSYEPIGELFLSTAYRKECRRFFHFLSNQSPLILADFEIPKKTQELLFGKDAQVVSVLENPPENFRLVIFLLCPQAKPLLKNWTQTCFLIDLSSLRPSIGNWNSDVWEKWVTKRGDIKILYTSALIAPKFEERKAEYIECLKTLESFGYRDKVYIAESGPVTPFSFFEEFSRHIFYANTNDLSLVNKGVNEVRAVKAAFDYFDFDDEDLIVKLTGRYIFKDRAFLELVESHPEVDAFVRPLQDRGVVTGCFAMRYKEYKKMLQNLDEEKMEEKLIDIEWEVAQYIDQMRKEGKKVITVGQIGLIANVSNDVIIEW